MKKFVFTLQTVYDLALSTEKQQKIQLKRIEDKLNRLIAELDAMKEAYLDGKDRLAQEMGRGMSGETLMQYSLYFEGLINMMFIQKENIVQTEAERDKWLQARIKTRKEIRTLEKAREKQYQAYLLEQKVESEKEIGDLVSYQVGAR